MIVCPRKSSDSRVNFCLNFDFRSLSSSQTLTLMRSEELWHSLQVRKLMKQVAVTFFLIDNLQVEALVPDRIELLRHCLGPLLNFADLDSDVWIGRAAFVLCYQPLRAYHCSHVPIKSISYWIQRIARLNHKKKAITCRSRFCVKHNN